MPQIKCILRGSKEELVASPAFEIAPDGEARRFVLESDRAQYPRTRRTGALGLIVSTPDGTVIEGLATKAFHEKYKVLVPEHMGGAPSQS